MRKNMKEMWKMRKTEMKYNRFHGKRVRGGKREGEFNMVFWRWRGSWRGGGGYPVVNA